MCTKYVTRFGGLIRFKSIFEIRQKVWALFRETTLETVEGNHQVEVYPQPPLPCDDINFQIRFWGDLVDFGDKREDVEKLEHWLTEATRKAEELRAHVSMGSAIVSVINKGTTVIEWGFYNVGDEWWPITLTKPSSGISIENLYERGL